MSYGNQLMDLGILGIGDSLLIDNKIMYIHALIINKSLSWSCSNKRTHDFVKGMWISECKEIGSCKKYLSGYDIKYKVDCEEIQKIPTVDIVEYDGTSYEVTMESDLYVVLHNPNIQMDAGKDIRNDDIIVKKYLIKG